MGIQIKKYPALENAILIACWPGLGNIGSIVGDFLVKQLGAEEMAEIEAWDFFYPRKVFIKSGVLEYLEFPANKFYYKKTGQQDVVIFVGEEEPEYEGGIHLQSKKALQLCNSILDVAEQFGCRRVYTCCAAISAIHHSFASRVWTVVNQESLKKDIKSFPNTVLMSAVEGQGRYSTIPRLKGLLPALAKTRGLEGVVLMGELPDYLTRVHLPYPKASKAVLQVYKEILGASFDFSSIDDMIGQIDQLVVKLIEEFPQEIRDRVEQRKSTVQHQKETITQDDENWIKQHIDELFKKGGGSGG